MKQAHVYSFAEVQEMERRHRDGETLPVPARVIPSFSMDTVWLYQLSNEVGVLRVDNTADIEDVTSDLIGMDNFLAARRLYVDRDTAPFQRDERFSYFFVTSQPARRLVLIPGQRKEEMREFADH